MKNIRADINDAQLAVLRSLLDGEGLRYMVRDDNLGGLPVNPLGQRTIFIDEDDEERILIILRDITGISP